MDEMLMDLGHGYYLVKAEDRNIYVFDKIEQIYYDAYDFLDNGPRPRKDRYHIF